MEIRSVHRTFSNPDGDVVTSVYEVTTDHGVFTVTRQFYAQGPSLFEWEIQGPGVLKSCSTKKAALRWLREN